MFYLKLVFILWFRIICLIQPQTMENQVKCKNEKKNQLNKMCDLVEIISNSSYRQIIEEKKKTKKEKKRKRNKHKSKEMNDKTIRDDD